MPRTRCRTEALNPDADAGKRAKHQMDALPRVSPAGKAAISRAAKKRWAEYRKSQQKKK